MIYDAVTLRNIPPRCNPMKLQRERKNIGDIILIEFVLCNKQMRN